MASQTHQYPSSPTTSSTLVDFTTHVSGNLHAGYGVDDQERKFLPPAKLPDYWTWGKVDEVLTNHSIVVSAHAIRHHYLRVFSILVYMNEVNFLVPAFIKLGFDDGKFPTEECPWPSSPLFSDFWTRFASHQWMFFPLELHPDRLLGTRLAPNRILPWKKEEIFRGDTSTVYKIVVHDTCNMVHQSHQQGRTTPRRNTFALKTYTKRGAHLYEKERKALDLLVYTKRSDNIVAYYGSFQHGETYNLILELANGGDLGEYLKSTPQPQTAPEIHDFWCSLTNVLKGLFRVHQTTEREHVSNTGHSILILHEDLKPENILLDRPENLTSKYKFQPKIADFGCSDVRNVSPDAQDENLSLDHHGSPTYSAPEISHHESYKHIGRYRMSEAADIWAMGCILSEAAVWVALGPPGLDEYTQLRQAETRRISNFVGSAYVNCFHNGIGPLNAVEKMHKRVVESLSTYDYITEHILPVVELNMMAQDTAQRWPADKLSDRIGHILDRYNLGENKASSRKIDSRATNGVSPDRLSGPSVTRTKKDQPIMASEKTSPASNVNSSSSKEPDNTPRVAQVPPRTLKPAVSKPPSQSTSQSSSRGWLHPISIARPTPPLSPRVSDLKTPVLTKNDFLGLSDVYNYREARKNYTRVDPHVDRLITKLRGCLSDRDHLFFFENSQSMQRHVERGISAFQSLSYLAKQIDTNGIELVLASNPTKVHQSANTTGLINVLRWSNFNNLGMMESNFSQFVENVVLPRLPQSIYRASTIGNGRRRSFSTGPKPLSIYVFTDGQWGERLERAAGIENPVSRLMQNITQRSLNRTHIMVQFIRFGDDGDGKRYLQYLDDDLGRKMSCDIVDTEPIDGNVFKMFIGSLNVGIDDNVQQGTASKPG